MKRIIITSLALFLLTGCSLKPFSAGDGGGLIVVADELDRPLVRPAVEAVFGRVIPTPQPEPRFRITWLDAQRLGEVTSSPLFLLAAPLDGEGPTADLLRRMLSPEVREGVGRGEYVLFKRRDPWAHRQLLLVLTGRDQRELAVNAGEWTDTLRTWAQEFEFARLEQTLFRRGEQTDEEVRLSREYNFFIRLQHDYLPAQENDSLGFVRYIRHLPERWLMVAWGPMESADSLTGAFVYRRRAELGGAFLDPVETHPDRWSARPGVINGRDAVLVRGLWGTVGPEGGGPFFSYGVFSEAERRYYIVDGAVMAPGREKMPFLWQLETMAQTFIPDYRGD